MTPAVTNMPGSATQVVFALLHPFLTKDSKSIGVVIGRVAPLRVGNKFIVYCLLEVTGIELGDKRSSHELNGL